MKTTQRSLINLQHQRRVEDADQSYQCGLYVRRNRRYHPASDDMVLEAALELARIQLVRGQALTHPRATREYLKLRIGRQEYESFYCLFTDTRHRLIACEELFRGSIDSASIYPREVVKRALALNAGAVIFAHNHPSGVAEPSEADCQITRQLKEALALVDVRVLDHLVVTHEAVDSMAERGML